MRNFIRIKIKKKETNYRLKLIIQIIFKMLKLTIINNFMQFCALFLNFKTISFEALFETRKG